MLAPTKNLCLFRRIDTGNKNRVTITGQVRANLLSAIADKKIPAPDGAGMETLFKLLDYSRVEKCLMVRHI